jgi:hypothetical protein
MECIQADELYCNMFTRLQSHSPGYEVEAKNTGTMSAVSYLPEQQTDREVNKLILQGDAYSRANGTVHRRDHRRQDILCVDNKSSMRKFVKNVDMNANRSIRHRCVS